MKNACSSTCCDGKIAVTEGLALVAQRRCTPFADVGSEVSPIYADTA